MQNHLFYSSAELHNATISSKQNIDMKNFLIKVFETLHPNKKMISNWHLDLMVEYLKAVESGDIKRLIVNLPPRSLKSICINIAWPAWLLGQSPHIKIIAVSYNQQLSDKHSIDCRTIMQSDWYRQLFPDTIIARGMNTKGKFVTTYHGFRFATSTGGTLTGEGADVIIIDDPTSASAAFSNKQRRKTYEWFRGCLLSRLNDSMNGKIVLVMQRLHADDLTGMLLKSDTKDHWRVLKIPAVSYKKQTISFGMFKYTRVAGENLYDNAYFIDSSGNKTLLNNKKAILSYIKPFFNINGRFLHTTSAIPDSRFTVIKNFFKLPNNDYIWNIKFSQINLFCDYFSLQRYDLYYSNYHIIQPKTPNYDLIFEKYLNAKDKPLIEEKIQHISSVNYDFNLVRAEVGSTIFNIQYQQEASASLQSIIKEEWLKKYTDYQGCNIASVDDLEMHNYKFDTTMFDYVYQSWDCAVKCGENNDYSVCSSWGVKNKKLYLLNIFRAKIDYPNLRKAIYNMSLAFTPDAILIEDCAAGQQIIQEINYISTSIRIIPIKPKNDKITRLTLVSPLFERGIVLLPKDATWITQLLDELLNFPEVENDDQVDSVSQFLLWYQKNEASKVISTNLNYKLNVF
jgi:predicted phage terminase large subunit-like protein